MWTAEWGKSKRRPQREGERWVKTCSYFLREASYLAPPEGSGEVAVFTSRNHLCAVSFGE